MTRRLGAAVVVIALGIAAAACAGGRRPISNARQTVAPHAINWSDIRIADGSTISRSTLLAILRARGGKDAQEFWEVHRDGGEIQITKSRKDQRVFAAGNAVELWYRDPAGSWRARPGA